MASIALASYFSKKHVTGLEETKPTLGPLCRPTPEKFTLFGNLPVELRIVIWSHALAGPRVVPLKFTRHAGRSVLRLTPPTLLFASHESRQVALQFYKPISELKAVCVQYPVYFEPSRDIGVLRFHLSRYHFEYASGLWDIMGKLGLSSLAINLDSGGNERGLYTRRTIVNVLWRKLRTGIRAMVPIEEITICTVAEDGPQLAGEIRVALQRSVDRHELWKLGLNPLSSPSVQEDTWKMPIINSMRYEMPRT
jgi:hypothetical protein